MTALRYRGARCWVLGAGCCTQHLALSTQHSIFLSAHFRAIIGPDVDVEAARNSGIDVAVLTTGSATYDQLREAHPDHMLDRFSDLLDVVRNGAAA